MSNQYFRFKQFTVLQDKCAMKVSTDACIAGAWTPVPEGAKRILDIGTGTGLLALMLAQRNPGVEIDAIELDGEAAMQAEDNVRLSPWSDRIRIIRADATTYSCPHCYDFIISNPPFFSNSLLGNKDQRNFARHMIGLNLESLFKIIGENLSSAGSAAILLPIPEFHTWEQMINTGGWQTTGKLTVYPSSGKMPNRIVGVFRRGGGNELTVDDTLFIREAGGDYTRQFRELMAPFYLKF